MTDEAIRELCIATTLDESGRHFTQWMNYWEELESAGYIEVHRPVHHATGMTYSQEYWWLEVTDAGRNLVESNPELNFKDWVLSRFSDAEILAEAKHRGLI